MNLFKTPRNTTRMHIAHHFQFFPLQTVLKFITVSINMAKLTMLGGFVVTYPTYRQDPFYN
jgi:hypothetical protein